MGNPKPEIGISSREPYRMIIGRFLGHIAGGFDPCVAQYGVVQVDHPLDDRRQARVVQILRDPEFHKPARPVCIAPLHEIEGLADMIRAHICEPDKPVGMLAAGIENVPSGLLEPILVRKLDPFPGQRGDVQTVYPGPVGGLEKRFEVRLFCVQDMHVAINYHALLRRGARFTTSPPCRVLSAGTQGIP